MRCPISIVIFLLLISSAEPLVGQRTLKRSSPPRNESPATRKPLDETSKSPSGKLVVGGAHAGLVGILEIVADMSLEGPLLISVSVEGSTVAQGNGDALVLPLSRKRDYAVQIKLRNGKNVIRVTDSVDRNETATVEWTAVGAETPGASVAAPVAAPVAVAPAPPAPVQGGSDSKTAGNLTVNALHTQDQVALDAQVGTLKGPFTITVTNNADGSVVFTTTKRLNREDTSFTTAIPLKPGTYNINVKSEHSSENAENVTFGPWTFNVGSPLRPNDFNKSANGKLTAYVQRVNGSGHLKVHTHRDLDGFKILVADSTGKEIDSRTFRDLPRNTNDWSLIVKVGGTGENTVTVSSLDNSETVTLTVPAEALIKPAEAETSQSEEVVEYDWGRVRGYFAGGMVFSKERDDFSESDIFLDFTLDKNYIARPFFKIWPDRNQRQHYLFKDFNTFFNVRLTSIPVAAAEPAEPGNGEGEEPEPCNTPDCEAFITSRKAAVMQAGIYLPMYWNFTTWYRRVPRPNRAARWEKNALFIAPLAKGGVMTVTGDRQTAEAVQFGRDDIFNFYSFGAMFGHFRLHARKKRNAYGGYEYYNTDQPIYEANPNIAPELISWLTISMGRFENFEIEVPTGEKDAQGNDITVRDRPWRYEALGRLKIPETPFIIGFDGNFGKGPDDLRFIFGMRFDVGKVMRTLKLAGVQDNMGQQSTPAPAPATPAPNSP